MKVKIFNNSNFNKYIDLVGDNDPEQTIVLGPRANTIAEVATEKRFVELSKEYRGKVVFRKL